MRVYLDASAALAQLMGDMRFPPPSLWSESLVSSRLIQYEIWTTLHARGLAGSHRDAARERLEGLNLVESVVPVRRTPWGDPEIQGMWPTSALITVPFERPHEFGTRTVLIG